MGAKAKHTKFSMFYGADEYLEQLSKKYEEYDELAALLAASPDGGHDAEQVKAAAAKGGQTGKMLALDVDADKRSKVTKRAIPTPNIPDPMPPNLAFMFTKISPEQKMYLWNIYTLIFALETLSVVLYWAMLRWQLLPFYQATALTWFFQWALGVQNIYILHDVIHGATFPPYEWQHYITHPWADFVSIPWMDIIMEHNRHRWNEMLFHDVHHMCPGRIGARGLWQSDDADTKMVELQKRRSLVMKSRK